MLSEPKLEQRAAQPYAAIRAAVPIPFGKYLPSLWDEVDHWLDKNGIHTHGPAIIRYLTTDMSKKLDMDVGFAIDQAIPGDKRILVDELPAGEYATLVYTGPYKGKGIFKATVTLLDWAAEHHIAWDVSTQNNVEWWNGRVEWYLSNPQQESDPKKI
jgi:effector-binding domain-containing protein